MFETPEWRTKLNKVPSWEPSRRQRINSSRNKCHSCWDIWIFCLLIIPSSLPLYSIVTWRWESAFVHQQTEHQIFGHWILTTTKPAMRIPSARGHWSLVTLFTVSTFWSNKDRVTSDQVCLESHTCHTKMVRPLCGRWWPYSCPKYHFGRKSRRKASFLSFEASFLKEGSQKSFVLDFRASKLHFWRKFRRKAWFLSLEASVLKEVS